MGMTQTKTIGTAAHLDLSVPCARGAWISHPAHTYVAAARTLGERDRFVSCPGVATPDDNANKTIVETVQYNNDQTITTSTGQFMAVQRNDGYAVNDGHWVVEQLPELYWSTTGTLRQRRPGKFLGVYATTEQAVAAIEAAELQPVEDKMVR